MCTNYVPTRQDRLNAHFGVDPGRWAYAPEAWPGTIAPLISRFRGVDPESAPGPAIDTGTRCAPACFGLIPHWSRDGRDFRRCYNARSETVASKPSFRDAWRNARFGIVPVDAFFEPNYEPNATGRPVRWRIEHADGSPMGIAAMWTRWRNPAMPSTSHGPDPGSPPSAEALPASVTQWNAPWITSFSMLTINADEHPLMQRFHAPGDEKRSVVILPPSQFEDWLDADPQIARDMLAAYPAERLRARADPLVRRSRSLAPPTPRPKKA
ncbi:MAG: SOS response-associated peptidase family protein [Burkholderiaceae bacterium]|nr:SOS response-associated peptidase family protein [Burkholderiaceae bacterium]